MRIVPLFYPKTCAMKVQHIRANSRFLHSSGTVCFTGRMGILAYLILGGIAGWIASMVMGTDAQQGIILNIVVGIVGALIGGMIFNFFGTSGVTGFNFWSLIVATLGAIVLLWIVQLVRGTR